MTELIYAVLIIALAVVTFGFLAWDLLSVWRARGWLGGAESSRNHDSSGDRLQTSTHEECYRYCPEHSHLNAGPVPVGCEEFCRAQHG